MKSIAVLPKNSKGLIEPWDSEVCHPRCAFKLYGEVNSVKKHNYKIWLNDGVISKEKLHVSTYSGHLQVFD